MHCNGNRPYRFFFLLLFLLTVALPAFSQQHIPVETWYDMYKEQPKEKYYVLKKDPKVVDSAYVSYYQNRNIKSEGSYYKGQPEGYWKYYYENGNLRMEGMMINNLQEGQWKYYYESGEPSMDGAYLKGDRTGQWNYYYENNTLKTTGTYENNKRQGDWVYYYEGGSVKGRAAYNNDKGEYTEYYESGNIKGKGPVTNGKSEGVWKYYYDDENVLLKAEGMERDGIKEGEWKFYYSNGNISSQGEYVNGTEQGEWKYYHENGTLSAKGQQKDGLREGEWNLYYKNGEFKGQGQFAQGDGNYEEYYENGKIKIKGYLKNNKSEGKWEYFYESGEKEGECFYTGGTGQYKGYYPDGHLKMTGTVKDGHKTGIWTLYKPNGEVAGYYTTYYENDSPMFKEIKDSIPPKKDTLGPAILPDARIKKKEPIWFRERVNEFHGIIFSANPVAVIRRSFPVYIEYHFQERLGYELNYTLYRDPLFKSHSRMRLDVDYYTGYSVFGRQKFYSRDSDRGMFWFGHEIRYSRIVYTVNTIDEDISLTDIQRLKKSMNQFDYSILVGDRLVGDAKHQGFTFDVFVGLGIGYRTYKNSWSEENGKYEQLFTSARSSSGIVVPLRAGFNIGYVFKIPR